MTALFTVGVILLILGFAATLGAALLRPAEKARISAAISSVAHNLNSSDPRIIAQLPLRLTVWFLDRFLGKRSFSLRRLGRSVVFGALLFGFSLGLSTLRSGNLPFPVEDAPWHTFDRAFGAIEASAKTIAENPKQTPETRARLAKAINKVKSLRNAENRSTYSVIYFPLLVLVCSVFMSLSFSIARCLLIEMGTANHLVSLCFGSSLRAHDPVLVFLYFHSDSLYNQSCHCSNSGRAGEFWAQLFNYRFVDNDLAPGHNWTSFCKYLAERVGEHGGDSSDSQFLRLGVCTDTLCC